MENAKNVLVIGAHEDECEFCTGGLSLLLKENDYKVFFLNIIGNESFWGNVGPDKYIEANLQSKEAAKVLGAEKILLPYRHHEYIAGDFYAQREIVKVVQEINPEIAMIHWPKDKWFDHRNVALNSFEALVQPNTFFEHNFISNLREIYAYEAGPYQTFDFKPDFYIDISDKIDSIIESFSLFQAMGKDIIEGLGTEKKTISRYRAVENFQWSNAKYAEAYKFIRYRGPGAISILPELLGGKFCMSSWPDATKEYC